MSFTKVLVGCLAAGALAVPPAAADAPTFDCGFEWVHERAVAPTYEGVAYGFVVHAGDAGATIRCYVEVDGLEVSSTPTGTGATAGPVSFSAGESSVVRLCAAASDAHGPTAACHEWTTQPIPPDELWDLLYAIFQGHGPPGYWESCALLDDWAGTYGPLVIGSDGDVYVDGEPEWDCPPYQHFPPA